MKIFQFVDCKRLIVFTCVVASLLCFSGLNSARASGTEEIEKAGKDKVAATEKAAKGRSHADAMAKEGATVAADAKAGTEDAARSARENAERMDAKARKNNDKSAKSAENRARGMVRREEHFQAQHVKRLEVLNKIAAVADEEGNESLRDRARDLIVKANEKHGKHMARLASQGEKAAK
jgi:hypothetical protein